VSWRAGVGASRATTRAWGGGGGGGSGGAAGAAGGRMTARALRGADALLGGALAAGVGRASEDGVGGAGVAASGAAAGAAWAAFRGRGAAAFLALAALPVGLMSVTVVSPFYASNVDGADERSLQTGVTRRRARARQNGEDPMIRSLQAASAVNLHRHARRATARKRQIGRAHV